MKDSKIQWTHHTFNPWWGCTRVSPGCVHCYAETFAKRTGHGWGPQAERRLFGDKHWNDPVKWNRDAEKAGERRRVFCASMADVFEDRTELEEQRVRLWALVEATPMLDWLLLTKRPENLARMLPVEWIATPRPNVWLGTTAEDQEYAALRIPLLLRAPAAVRFVSYEPALGPVDLESADEGCLNGWYTHWRQISEDEQEPEQVQCDSLDWIIVGGESGPGARPFDVEWARSTVAQCKAAGVACFVKQLGARPRLSLSSLDDRSVAMVENFREFCRWPNSARFEHEPDLAIPLFNDRKGGDWSEWPEDLRVREFPR